MFLNCHSYHSLRYGTISIEDLVQQAVNLNIKTLALTDINTVTGIYDFYRLCQENHIKPIVGVDIRLKMSSTIFVWQKVLQVLPRSTGC